MLGNGGIGVIVRTRPDAVVLHFGHNNVWDIRIAEENTDKYKTFREIFEKIRAIPDTVNDLYSVPWYYEYRRMCRENYSKSYPRPFPCGSLVLGFDKREVELIGHKLDISIGLCEVNLLIKNTGVAKLQIFTDMENDAVWIRLVDAQNRLRENCFNRIQLMPDPSTPEEFPRYTTYQDSINGIISFRQILPALVPEKYDVSQGHPRDRAVRLTARINQSFGRSFHIGTVTGDIIYDDGALNNTSPLIILARLEEGLASQIPDHLPDLPLPDEEKFQQTLEASTRIWENYWSCSGIQLDDPFLEKIWYHNSYFFNCSVKEGTTCPGLFANWSYQNIGTAWHGDYHLDYNWQQPFWFTFSSNHLDKNKPYIDAVYHMLPVSRKWANEYYGLRGACFPVSAYPVEMTTNPYPCPDWGWMISMTPWAVQGLWWHYLYSMDSEYLKQRLFEPIKDAVLFLVDYMKRPETRGQQWGDDSYHIFPTVVPELYGRSPLPHLKYDCLVDLTLAKFIFKAYLQAVKILKIENEENDLIGEVEDILMHFPEYRMVDSEKYGKVIVSVPGEHPEIVYNTPNNLMTIFPGEEHGMQTGKDTLQVLKNTLRNSQVEGGNEVVFQHIQAARLGMLDLDKFKRQVKYCLLPNGTVTNKVLQVHGRYRDHSEFDFMASMGIWFENFSLPVVINECLLQSYNGIIRLFPNWPEHKDAEFSTLKAVGAFLVSASYKEGRVQWVEIKSEAGADLSLIIPWKNGCRVESYKGSWEVNQSILKIPTQKGEIIRLTASD